MSMELPVLPIRIHPPTKQVVEALAFREKLTPGTYGRQRLELSMLRGIVKRIWHKRGFRETVRLLCPESVQVVRVEDDTWREPDPDTDPLAFFTPVLQGYVEWLANQEQVSAPRYVQQRLELTILRGVVKRQWREHGFEAVVRRLCPELLASDHHVEEPTANGNGTARATKVHKVLDAEGG